MSLGTRVIYEKHGKRQKYDLDELIAKMYSKDKIEAKIFSEILLEVNNAAPKVKDFEDRFTVYFVSPSNKKEYENTHKIVQVRGICYFKEEIYNKF